MANTSYKHQLVNTTKSTIRIGVQNIHHLMQAVRILSGKISSTSRTSLCHGYWEKPGNKILNYGSPIYERFKMPPRKK